MSSGRCYIEWAKSMPLGGVFEASWQHITAKLQGTSRKKGEKVQLSCKSSQLLESDLQSMAKLHVATGREFLDGRWQASQALEAASMAMDTME